MQTSIEDRRDDMPISAAGEPAIYPDLPIVDAHHHLWVDAVFDSQSPYLLDEFGKDLATGHDVIATVHVECGSHYLDSGPSRLRPVGETIFVNRIAESAAKLGMRTRVADGIVGFADLELGDAVDEVLEGHLNAAPTRFRGVRHYVCPLVIKGEYIDTEQRLLKPSFRSGLRRLAAYGLSFDAVVFDFQLGDLLDTARAIPELTFIVNHLGGVLGIGPFEGQRNERFPAWKASIFRLSELPNVYMKLGGFGLFYTGLGFENRSEPTTSDEYVSIARRYFEHATESFGPNRCLFESNFPPDKITAPYSTLWNAFKKMASGCSPDERTELFSGTASRIYGLDRE